MKLLKNFSLLLIAFVCCTTPYLFAETSNNFATQMSDLLDTVDQKESWAVREWMKSKRIALNNKTGDFSIAGDVKAKWRNVHQKLGTQVVMPGPDTPSQWPSNPFTIEFVLYLDYKADKTWASIKLDFDEAAGLFNGQANNLALVRANMGYHLYDDGRAIFDVIVGRQRSYELYSSQIQFNSTLDGFTGIYSTSLDSFADFNFQGGGYIFNAVQSHPVWIFQLGLHDILDTGFYTEYAFCDWHKNTLRTSFTNPAGGAPYIAGSEKWAFQTNQFVLGYDFNPEVFGRDVRLFGGILWNALARKRVMEALSNGKTKNSQNLGGWVTLRMGSVQKAGDWAFQTQWQVVQPYAVPDWDVSGFGRGNATSSSLFGFTNFAKPQNFPGNGNANYNGFEIDLLYSVTNELVLEMRIQRSLATTKGIGRDSKYTNFSLATIYAF